MSGDWLGFASAATAGITMALWMRRVQAVDIPRVRVAWHVSMGLALGLGLAAFGLGTSFFGGAAAVFGAFLGGLFLVLRMQSGQAATRPAVELGGPILDFVAPDDEGKPFELATLRGRPFLLKFFRGHW